MARYFLHLIDSTDILLDPEGVEMTPDAIPGLALAAARDCMAGDIRSGRLDLHYRIEVVDEGGECVHSLRFADAVTIRGALPS